MIVATRPTRSHSASPRPVGFRLRGRSHKVALIAHVLASVGWFGVAVVVAFCGIAAAATGDPSLSHALYRTAPERSTDRAHLTV